MKTCRARIISIVVAVLGLILTYAGCATERAVGTETKFNYSEHKRYMEPGGNSIKGGAFLRLKGNGFATCAGIDVVMIPATSFFRETMRQFLAGRQLQLDKLEPAVADALRRSRCDARGNFSFTNVPNGTWFVLTAVTWNTGSARQGATLMREVTFSNNNTVEVLLTEKDIISR